MRTATVTGKVISKGRAQPRHQPAPYHYLTAQRADGLTFDIGGFTAREYARLPLGGTVTAVVTVTPAPKA